MLRRFFRHPDVLAHLLLIGLWLLFFWRLFTPVVTDQASLERGDFSGQFVAFAGYQYQRLTQGEIPLWNPYNNGGLPFIADTQAAVFYPPRLLTIALSYWSGGWSYHALELEMTFHVLLGSFFMYLLIRRMTHGQAGTYLGGLVGSIIVSYGGFLQSYPPLQLALLEAAIWLPLAIVSIHEATRSQSVKYRWLVLTGLAYGLSWMAGHPQTTFFLTYLLAAYCLYRGWMQRYPWWKIVLGVALFGLLGGALAAVQLLPGFEYLSRTARSNMWFDAKGNGFPFQDVIQFVFPGIVSLWSPLYVSLGGLVLAGVAVWQRLQTAWFWGAAALLALGLSFGSNSPLFDLLYNILPGLRFFRGQERAAYIVTYSLAILAGLAATHLTSWHLRSLIEQTKQLLRSLWFLVGLCGVAFAGMLAGWMVSPEAFGPHLPVVGFALLSSILTHVAIRYLITRPSHPLIIVLVVSVITLDIFTLSMDRPSNYDSVPPSQQLSMTPPELLSPVIQAQATAPPFRVDGYRGLHDNYGSLYQIMDMRGISPLFLEGPWRLQQGDLVNPRAWELFAVRYVFSDWEELPVPSQIITRGTDRFGAVNLHELTTPRPFAHLVYDARIIPDEVWPVLDDPTLNLRETVVLEGDPGVSLDGSRPPASTAEITAFAPEAMTIAVSTPADGILTLAHPYYPGWQASINGVETTLFRAYGALSAIGVPAGSHTITLRYDPVSYQIGAVVSLLTWIGIIGLGLVQGIRYVRQPR
jgi:uncharacterized membrane protein YfhO